MTDDGFRFIGPAKAADAFITVHASSARLSSSARESIKWTDWVTIESNAKLMVKITPCTEDHPHASKVHTNYQIEKVSKFARDRGCRLGRYPVEARDGSLYFQLEPNP